MAKHLQAFSPSETHEAALNRAAELFGIEREYWDIWGKHHVASLEGIAAVLRSMGIDSNETEEIDRAVEDRLWEHWSRLSPVTVVASVNEPNFVVYTPATSSGILEFSVKWEDGSTNRTKVDLRAGKVTDEANLRGQRFVETQVALQLERRLGYHDLQISLNGGAPAAVRWILAPDRAFSPRKLAENGRAGGIFVSLYGLRSSRNWGCGDFTDLCQFIEWAAYDLDVSFIGLNPLHAIPNRQPYNTSPYLPACSFYKNFIYLNLEACEDFQQSPCARKVVESPKVQNEIRQLRDAKYVEYERVHKLKLRVLKMMFRRFLQHEFRNDTPRARAFRKFADSEGSLLHQYATFCALDETIHRRHPSVWLWSDWPVEYQQPNSAATEEFAREHWRSVLFYQYVQWLVDQQLAAAHDFAKKLGLAVGLYHDLALATDRFGADLWANRRFYVEGCRVGAPPDDFSPNGQDWSFPPPNSETHFRDGYRLFAESIRKNVRHGGALRIDHVMRFFHLFWIPDQLEAKHGIYVRDRHLDLVRILALESVRNEVVIVGEDLGTVADEVRETLARFGILSYRLFYFERHKDGSFKRPDQYPEKALVSASTHDLPTLAGFWEGRDIEARRAAGMFRDHDGYHAQLADRLREKQRIFDILLASGLLPAHYPRNAADVPTLTGDLHFAIVGFLAATPSAWMLLSEEDLMKCPDQQNLPGTTEEYPNWRHKTRFPVEELRTHNTAKDFTRMYRYWLEKAGRTNSAKS